MFHSYRSWFQTLLPKALFTYMMPTLSIGAPLCLRGTWNQEGGGAHISGTLNDE